MAFNAGVILNDRIRKMVNQWIGKISGKLDLGKFNHNLDRMKLKDTDMEILVK